jgi:hypothetical protein
MSDKLKRTDAYRGSPKEISFTNKPNFLIPLHIYSTSILQQHIFYKLTTRKFKYLGIKLVFILFIKSYRNFMKKNYNFNHIHFSSFFVSLLYKENFYIAFYNFRIYHINPFIYCFWN